MHSDGQGSNPFGAGRRKKSQRDSAAFPKGRQVDPQALEAIRALLGDQPRRRDLLIEFLHLIQERFGCLRAAHLAALASELKLALTEVYEVATFYAHFDVIADDHPDLPEVTVRVCESVSCALAGGLALHEALVERQPDSARVLKAPCVGRCEQAPAAVVGHNTIGRASVDRVLAAVLERDVNPKLPSYLELEAYRKQGGYRLLEEYRAGRHDVESVITRLDAAGLRGLGGAGFRSAQKWRLVREQPGPRLLAVNADEGEPGTFKDRYLLETDPHRVLEGMLIAAWAVEAEAAYFYLRDEYAHIHEILKRELADLTAAGLDDGIEVHLRRGAGAYICGEETAMLESIEGKRGYPRHKPPFPTQVGLFGRPTLIHNVETLYWLRSLLDPDAVPPAESGRRGRTGWRHFSVSGRVREPGVKLAPAGVSARELIDEFSGGMLAGHEFRGYLPGGASGGILPAALADLPLDFGTLEPHGCFIGSAAIVVLSDQDDLRAVALNLMRFFEEESCGQCTPCRLGTEKAAELMRRPVWDEALLNDLSTAMRDASICGLGQAAPNPVLSLFRHFPEDMR